jgi:hypothetical protein
MSSIDALPILGFAKGVRTDTATTDAAVIEIPVSPAAPGFIVDSVHVYNAQGGSSASATLGVFGAAGGGGAVIVADAALTGVTGPTVVSARTVAATAVTPAVRVESLFVRIGTASGVAGSTVDVVIHGRKLP